jgi:hypothetical protein
MRSQTLLQLKVLVAILLLLPLASMPAGAAEAPASVPKLTVAMDGWASDLIDPWENAQGSFISDLPAMRPCRCGPSG